MKGFRQRPCPGSGYPTVSWSVKVSPELACAEGTSRGLHSLTSELNLRTFETHRSR
jgi:hypothetical protein